jgi:predicted Rossmann fold nucleotide-binding protein DprA/Smf involved in DNA uptake
VSDFLEQKRNEIAERMRELEPLIDEYRQLEAAASALAGVAPSKPARPARAAAATRRPAAPARPRRAATTSTAAAGDGGGAKRRGRPRGSGVRAQQALDLVGARPGITIPEMAQEMGIKQNYLYRVLPTLEKEGKVVKQDRGWHSAPNGAAA